MAVLSPTHSLAMRRTCHSLVVAVLLVSSACDDTTRRGDTLGVQTRGRWEWKGRLVVAPDPRLTLVHMSIDTTDSGPRADVAIVRYEFDPMPALGDEYALTLGLNLGNARRLRPYTPYTLGAATAQIPAHATVTCLCAPLREDSIRGTFQLSTRGLRQLTGRIDATLYFTEWNNPARHTAYPLHQRFDAVK